MKRFMTLALVAMFVLGLASMSAAKEVQMKGQFVHHVTWLDNADFSKDNSENEFRADQRIRVYFDYISSEALNAVLGFEINSQWGNVDEGGDLGTDGLSVLVKHAYTNFVIPHTPVSVRVGLQPVAWKGAYGSPIFDDDAAGIIMNAPFTDWFSASLGWVRAYDNLADDENKLRPDDSMDLITLSLDFMGDGWNVTPYGIFGFLGHNAWNKMYNNQFGPTADDDDDIFAFNGLAPLGPKSPADDDMNVWWTGLNFDVSVLDPIVIKGDFIYGSVDDDDSENDRSGWFADLGIEYKVSWGTFGLMGMYGSGDDDDLDNGSEAMPVLNDSGFGLTTFGFSGAVTGGFDSALGTARYDMWAVGAYLADFTFIEDLTHKLIVVYGQGTSDSEAIEDAIAAGPDPFELGAVLSDEDSFVEVNFDTQYMIYENLAAIAELGYIHMDRDDKTWKNSDLENADDDAFKAAFYLKYDF